jgi:hypothetical protein
MYSLIARMVDYTEWEWVPKSIHRLAWIGKSYFGHGSRWLLPY